MQNSLILLRRDLENSFQYQNINIREVNQNILEESIEIGQRLLILVSLLLLRELTGTQEINLLSK